MKQTEFRVPLSALLRPTAPPVAGEALRDALGRPLHDLRISVTDRCNFRCTYCMPRDKFGREHPFLAHDDILRYEEIARLARLFAGLGVRKIRLTGGEPLMRRHLDRLVGMLAQIPGLDLTLTTNGALLARHAAALRAAGLNRVTVSLDALDDAVFRRMSDAHCGVADVLEGIDAAAAAGLGPVKINMVVRRGLNEDQILPLVRRFHGSGHILRFIEYMDVGASNGWRLDDVVSAREILARVAGEFPLEPLDPNYRGEVAERWRFRDGGGELGIIASVTQAFCRDCTRLRLSPEGKLFTCLFAGSGHDLRARLRDGADDAALAAWIGAVWQARNDRYSELRSAAHAPAQRIEMSYIGG
ncbi:MAG: GTP 3',8-cyclase MoaA [Candidatus Dactylopiibacterium sp.]|nr:GTP 3',8-cyclase MoaA [Candidatus Dactylopiibacterium sp.]